MAAFFLELSLVMVVALVISFIMNAIKQPLLVGYIITGVVVSPLFFDIMTSYEDYKIFSHIGIALLLFMVGLHLNLKLVKEVGKVSLITGLGQVCFTVITGFLLSNLLGFSTLSSLFIAVALSFSSTIIIVKLLSDKKDLDTLYGKISIGFLLVQDFIAVLLLMVVGTFISVGVTDNLILAVSKSFGLGVIAIFLTYLLSHYALPTLLEKIAKSKELFFVFIIAWCLGISSLFDLAGFSIEIGALLAGVALASSPYQYEITSRVKPLRDFFLVIFFLLLGFELLPDAQSLQGLEFGERMGEVWSQLGPLLGPALLLSVLVLIGNHLIVFYLMNRMRYANKVAFKTGLSVTQISEFSLIFVMLGRDAGLVTKTEVSLVTLIAIITITLSTYIIFKSEPIFKFLEPSLKRFAPKRAKEDIKKKHLGYETLVFGYDRVGYSILKSIEKLEGNYLVVDYDPQVIKKLEDRDVNCIYGDAENVEFLEEISFEDNRLLVSTIPNYETNLLLLEHLRKNNKEAKVILSAGSIEQALELYKAGADYVILPHFLGAKYVSSLIQEFKGDFRDFLKEKITHINELKERKEQGHEHPRVFKE